jgi:hypothetical protein
MPLHEKRRKFRENKYFSDAFSIENDLKQWDYSPSLLFNLPSEYSHFLIYAISA